MSIVLTERMAILKKMEYLEKERALLLASYDSCLDRLRELDEIDRMSAVPNPVSETMKQEDEPKVVKRKVLRVHVPTYVKQEQWDVLASQVAQLEQKTELVPVSPKPLNLENSDIVSGDPEQEETQEQEGLNFLVHKEGQTLQEYFEENKESLPNVEEPKEEVKEDKPEEPVVGTDHENLQMKPSLMRGTTNDNRIVAQFAKVILKDFGVPIKAKLLIEKLRDTGLVLKSPYETLKQIMQYEPGIQKAGFGFYQYVPVHSKSL
ncbi:hypothetical protein BCVP_CDS0037 [Bacillus phage BC-VP]|nr:hypothetical protein BCVP_CDS0037 [Bacillus phage BC-VP]